MSRLDADGLLLFTAFLWGVTFVAQKYATATMPALAFVAARFAVSAAALAPFALWEFRRKPHAPNRYEWRLALVIGLGLFLGTSLQQAGIETTSATNAGFLTACYVVLTPFVVWALTGVRPRVSRRRCGLRFAHRRLAACLRRPRSSERRRRARAPRRFRLGDGHRPDADLPCPLGSAAAARLRTIYGLRWPRGAVLGAVRIDPAWSACRDPADDPVRWHCLRSARLYDPDLRPGAHAPRRGRADPRARRACSRRSRARSCLASV